MHSDSLTVCIHVHFIPSANSAPAPSHTAPSVRRNIWACASMCQRLMINDPPHWFLLLPSSLVVSHTSSRVTVMDAGRRLEQLLLGLMDINRPSLPLHSYIYTHRFKAVLIHVSVAPLGDIRKLCPPLTSKGGQLHDAPGFSVMTGCFFVCLVLHFNVFEVSMTLVKKCVQLLSESEASSASTNYF